MPVQTRVAVVDDEAEFRAAYKAFFARCDGFEWAGEAADGKAGVALWRQARPDVTLIDLAMPVMAGEDAIRQIRRLDPDACLIALTSFATPDHVLPALDAGASGYLLKDCPPDQLLRAIQEARCGGIPLSADVGRTLVNATLAHQPRPAVDVTPRERELLQHLAAGLSNHDIAQAMYLSVASIKQHLSRLGDKFGGRTRTQILTTAVQQGIIHSHTLGATNT